MGHTVGFAVLRPFNCASETQKFWLLHFAQIPLDLLLRIDVTCDSYRPTMYADYDFWDDKVVTLND